MTERASRLFGVGVAGPEITTEERAILRRHPPRSVILFRRNVESEAQIARFAADVAELCGDAFLCVDQEGGPVDRLRDLAGPFPSFHAAARAGRAREAGELAGEACARLDIALDLAPVVDRRISLAGETVLGERAASDDPHAIVDAAALFLDGLRSRGVAGCLKHFPGLGRARSDTHFDLPALADDPPEKDRDLLPFRALMDATRAIMVSHAAVEADGRPASLSLGIATGLLRDEVGFDGVAFTDDLEMGALSTFGELPERCAAAALAGCDLLFVCSRISELSACIDRVEREVPEPRLVQAARRLDDYDRFLREIRAGAPPPRPLEAIRADVAALRELIANSQQLFVE